MTAGMAAKGSILALLAGTLFGGGLAVGGMVDPVRVRNFLDVGGHWDPTLAFVMVGAVAVMALAWRLQRGMARPLWSKGWSLPDRSDIDARLVLGALIFGVGWGIGGICPGPALASLALSPAIIPFVVAMVAGMAVHYLVIEKRKD